MAQGEPYGGVEGGSSLPARLIATLFDIFIFLSGANLSCGPMQSQQIQGSDPEDKGGDGVLQQGHRGEGLQ